MVPQQPGQRASKQDGAESELALQANLATYDDLGARNYIDGAPHLKHGSIRSVYRSMVTEAIRQIGREPADLSVLEIGAGSGLSSTPWLDLNVGLTAVDPSRAMLEQFRVLAARYGSRLRTIEADAATYLMSTREEFDIVTHVSMLHHVPDYGALLRAAAAHVRSGGCLITFQDPLRYDTMRARDHVIDRACYFVWRLGRGNYRRGLRTRLRRLRGVYSRGEAVDFDEYHVVRNGVDSEAIANLLRPKFSDVKLVKYWSTYSPLLQAVGEKLGLVSSFGLLASGRLEAAQPPPSP